MHLTATARLARSASKTYLPRARRAAFRAANRSERYAVPAMVREALAATEGADLPPFWVDLMPCDTCKLQVDVDTMTVDTCGEGCCDRIRCAGCVAVGEAQKAAAAMVEAARNAPRQGVCQGCKAFGAVTPVSERDWDGSEPPPSQFLCDDCKHDHYNPRR